MDKPIELAVQEIIEKYNPHTVIVYGSRARGDATADSDVDLACFIDSSDTPFEDTRNHHGVFIDAWIYPTDSMTHITEFIKLEPAFCAIDKRGLGRELLNNVKEELKKPLPSLNYDEKRSIIELRLKILKQASVGDLDGNFRKSWLLQDLLQTYFILRDLRFFGSKHSFNLLKNHDLIAYELFQKAYQSSENIENLKKLTNFVLSVSSD